MVKVVDSFVQLYGRPPTQEEVSKMMELKAQLDRKIRSNLPKMVQEIPHNAGRKIKLTKTASIINRMLLRGMAVTEISTILGKSHQAVSEMKRRYNLPIQETTE